MLILYRGWAMRWLHPDLMPQAIILQEQGDAPAAPVQVFGPIPEPVPEPAAPASQAALMVLPESAKRGVRMRGHAAPPGTGPAGLTCGGCASCVSRQGGARRFSKCLLAKARWTHGGASDIRRKDPACSKWSKRP